MELSKGLDWIEHAGARILKLDLSGAEREGQIALLEALGVQLQASPQPVRLLVLSQPNIEYNPDVAMRSRGLLLLGDKIGRSAFVGMSGMAKTVAEGYFDEARLREQDVSQRGRHYPPERLGEALDWLARG